MGRSNRVSGAVDEAFVTLTRAANNSALWMMLAGVLATAGGGLGRAAARRGLAAIGVASFVSNVPLKLAFRRPRPMIRPPLVPLPKSSSFPSGHSASAFAFATAVSCTQPPTALLLLPLATAVAYSRVHVGVHRKYDVVIGSAIGVASGVAAVAVARMRGSHAAGEESNLPQRDVVLVTSPNAGNADVLDSVRRELRANGFAVTAEIDVDHLGYLRELIEHAPEKPQLVVVAGGDGTIGAVADAVANADVTLGVVPIGTSNNFARSVGVPMDCAAAVAALREGSVTSIDVGRFVSATGEQRHFVHAATAGLNVDFARFATKASVRERLGRLTYVVAATRALRERPTFECELRSDGQTHSLTLTQLAVVNTPAFGGALRLSVSDSRADDGLLDVLAIEDAPLRRLVSATARLIIGVHRKSRELHVMQVDELKVQTPKLGVTLDGEIAGSLPGEFHVVRRGLKVVTPRMDEA